MRHSVRAASYFLFSFAFTFGAAEAQQQFPLAIPLRAVAQDAGTPIPVTWIASEGGLFRSELGGTLWRSVYLRPAGQVQPVINRIVVDPKNPQVVYLVTDMEDGGIWKSSDRGNTWATASAGLPRAGTTELFMLPSSPQTLYVRAGDQLFKSTDAAATWSVRSTLPGGATVLAIDPKDSNQMYAARINAIYRTRDEGTNWTLTPPLSLIGGNTAVTSLLVDPTDSNIIHAAVAGPKDSRAGFYRSNNRGDRFDAQITSPLLRFTPGRLIADPTGTVIVAEAEDPFTIYRTADKGIEWKIVNNLILGQGRTVLAFDPNNPRLILAGTTAGLAESTDGGSQWQRRVGFAVPTISSPAQPLEFAIPAGMQGRLQFGLSVLETNLWTLSLAPAVEGASWLSLSSVPINTPASPILAVNTGGLELGEYQASVRVDAPAAGNSPLKVPVKLSVVRPPSATLSYRISTVIGSGLSGNFGDNGPAVRAAFRDLDSAALDQNGNIYVSDPQINVVRRVDTSGIISRVAGNGLRGDSGDSSSATIAQLNLPAGVGVDQSGTLFICDSGNRKIRKVTPDGTITTLAAGVGACKGMAIDSFGNVLIAVPEDHVIRRVTPNGQVSDIAGLADQQGFRGDGGAATLARLNSPSDVAIDPLGRILIADTGNHRVRRIANNVITTVAGSGAYGYQGEGPDAQKLAFASPTAVAGDAAGNIYIADSENNLIRRVAPNGAVSLMAGTGVSGFSGDNGPAVRAQIAGPQDLVVEPGGALLSVEGRNLRVRRLSAPPEAVAPQISEGPVNWADESPRLAPGTIFRLRGTDLALSSAARANAPWPIDIGGARVTLNGLPLPLSQVSPTEIVGLIPVTAALGPGTLVVARDEVPSIDFAVTLEPSAPAIIPQGEGRALAVNQDGSVNSPDQPAAADSRITVYFTGSGAAENPPAGGAGAGEESKLLSPVAIQFAELTLEPELARLTPGRNGLAEVRFVLPAGLEPGEYPVMVRVGNGTSAPQRVSVGRRPE